MHCRTMIIFARVVYIIGASRFHGSDRDMRDAYLATIGGRVSARRSSLRID